MIANSSIIKQQQSRSFFEMITVHWKLAKFYSYNFFTTGGSYFSFFLYFAFIIVPLSALLWIRSRPGLRYLLAVLLTIPPFDFLLNRSNFFYFFHISLSQIPLSHVKINLPFLQRREKKEASVQEGVIISSVNKIRVYDLPLFEFTLMFFLQFLHFALVLTLSFFVPFPDKRKNSGFIFYCFWRSFLQYFLALSSGPLNRFIVGSAEYFEFFVYVLPEEYCPSPLRVKVIRVMIALFCFSKVLFDNYLKIISLHK